MTKENFSSFFCHGSIFCQVGDDVDDDDDDEDGIQRTVLCV